MDQLISWPNLIIQPNHEIITGGWVERINLIPYPLCVSQTVGHMCVEQPEKQWWQGMTRSSCGINIYSDAVRKLSRSTGFQWKSTFVQLFIRNTVNRQQKNDSRKRTQQPLSRDSTRYIRTYHRSLIENASDIVWNVPVLYSLACC